MYSKLESNFAQLSHDNIPEDRKEMLDEVRQSLQEILDNKKQLNLHFICTHNSRRSQMAQVLAQALASMYKKNITCYSGGTEVTAFNFTAVETLHEFGFRVKVKGEQNPTYTVSYDESNPSIRAFSKRFDDASIPEEFVAIMTCSDADKNCPFIPNALLRIPVRYEDPNVSDGTPNARNHYKNVAMQIATEWNYIISQL